MALYKCPECGHDISSDADACPNCGWKSSSTRMREAGEAMQSAGDAIGGCGAVLTLFVTVPIALILLFMGL